MFYKCVNNVFIIINILILLIKNKIVNDKNIIIY